MPPPLKDVHLVIAETLEVAQVVRQSQPIRDGSRRKHQLPLVFVGAQPVRRFSGPTLRSRCTNPWWRSRAPLPDAHSRRWIVGRAKDRVGSPLGRGRLPAQCRPNLVLWRASASRAGLDRAISTQYPPDLPPTSHQQPKPSGWGYLLRASFCVQKSAQSQLSPLSINSSPLQKRLPRPL